LPAPSVTVASKPGVFVPAPVTVDPSGRSTTTSYEVVARYPAPVMSTVSPGE